MRWPLRRQILLPMLAVMLATVACVSGVNAWLSTRRTLRQVEQQLRDVVETLAASNFPLTRSVLRQTRGLTGADYAVTDVDGALIASSDDAIAAAARDAHPPREPRLALGRTLEVGGVRYFYAASALDRRPIQGERLFLHIYYPELEWRQAQREAVLPPLALGVGAMLVVGLVSAGVAARVTRPIGRLRTQVERIAEGDFQPLPPAARNDEIRDLCLAVNRMAALLARYEDQVRRTERLRTLGQLGGGLAHQMRNAATGCRMALDLHRRICSAARDDDNLSVAERQLTLMETHLRRFLSLGRRESGPLGEVDLARLTGDVLPLVRHTAAHVGVELHYEAPTEPLLTEGDSQALQQVVVNLVLNAIEAVTQGGGSSGLRAAPRHKRVDVTVEQTAAGAATIAVRDTGAGPDPRIVAEMFEPLVSDKPDGAGLGLAVAREIAERHGGRLTWRRESDCTLFELVLPVTSDEAAHGTLVDR